MTPAARRDRHRQLHCPSQKIMQLYKVKDSEELSKKAAAIVSAQIILEPASVLGLATGSTPLGTYRELIRRYQAGELDFSRVHTVNLDEYRGLSPEHPQSYHYYMRHHLFDHINLPREQSFLPDGTMTDTDAACKAYDERISALGGIDLQILGIGGNGHIGFNEPASSFEKDTHLVTLAQETRAANARFFSSMDEVPTQACTMGIGGIFSARRILLLASGKTKAEALHAALFGPITPQVPASILQLHPHVIVVGDEDAFSLCGL